mmetsp:Transcript_29000/g.27906  ORF Transcript_29000/g.27906 Transcript_29000/m.27906 type:complete len:94 (+) Transcript_29000:243-524(+)
MQNEKPNKMKKMKQIDSLETRIAKKARITKESQIRIAEEMRLPNERESDQITQDARTEEKRIETIEDSRVAQELLKKVATNLKLNGNDDVEPP